MKRFIVFSLCFISIASFYGCGKSLEDQQKEALKSCKDYILNSDFTEKETIDYNIVEFDQISEGYIESAKTFAEEPDLVDNSDWIVTIGDTSSLTSFCKLIADSDTLKCIGFVPVN